MHSWGRIPPPMSNIRTFLVPTTSRPYAIAAAVDSTIKCTLEHDKERERESESEREKENEGDRKWRDDEKMKSSIILSSLHCAFMTYARMSVHLRILQYVRLS